MTSVAGPNNKEMTINLHIKTLNVPVAGKTPVMVIWSRGNKKASTKKRLLNEMVSRAVIDEKFQINTVIDVDEDGEPSKPKMSMLSVVGDKATGIIGQAELNLCQYGLDEFKLVTLPLMKC